MARVTPRLALVAVLLSLSIAEDAASQPTPRFPAEQPVPLSARVALLEQRVHGLEQRLKAFEKVSLSSAKSDGSYSLTLNGARVVIAKDGTATVMPAPPPTKAAMPADDCDPPYAVDANGRRSIKPECMQQGPPCDPPYVIDSQGRRSVKKECL